MLTTKVFGLIFVFVCAVANASAQQLEWPGTAATEEIGLSRALPDLAKQAIAVYQDPDRARYLNTLFQLQIVARQYPEAITSIESLTELRRASDPTSAVRLLPFLIEAKTRSRQQTEGLQFDEAFKQEFRKAFSHFDDLQASDALPWFGGDLNRARNDLAAVLEKHKGKDRIALPDALDLIRSALFYKSLEARLPLNEALTDEEDSRRYVIDKQILIETPDGAHIAAEMVRPKSVKTPQPALLIFTIYVGDGFSFASARQSAARGYVGMVGYTRGKARSPETPVPYEHDGDDVRAVIDWIIKQPWSDGRVGMYSGSYNGFTQWAAAKKLPSALKTIVPSRANNAGNGLPMENNIFLLVNYAWPFYTTNNKYLDNETYFDPRWGSLNQKWYESGASYRKVDSIDGMPNKWFQIWLKHPSYDWYWQQLVPYKNEFARINIPVLTITGYFDGGQGSVLWYLREHYKYDPRAEHYLVIGPYDHFGADRARKEPVVNGYAIDPVAQFDTQELIYQWMNYIFRGAPKPAMLADKINYQVMGANEWKHAPSIEKMSNTTETLFLTDVKLGDKYQLAKNKPSKVGFLEETVDFADRKTTNNADYWPFPIVGIKPDLSRGFAFISEPFDQSVEISGIFSGQINAIINKKDVDIGVTLYEVRPNGELVHLSFFIGRASYAKDMSVRKLLTPGKLESISFDRSRMTSRRLSKGSRLLVTLNVNKHPFAQINYGTGKDVSDEDINDAKTPLQIKWRNDSYVRIPIWK